MTDLERNDLTNEDPRLGINPNEVKDMGLIEARIREIVGSVLLVVSLAGEKFLKDLGPRG